MEQRKMKVITHGEIDMASLDELFFEVLLNRIAELYRNEIVPQSKTKRIEL